MGKNDNNPFTRWAWAFFAAALAVLALALTPTASRIATTGWNKTNHLLAFAVLAWLGLKAYPRHAAAVLIGLFAYGALVEILQIFIPSRAADWTDLIANILGLLLGWGFGQVQGSRGKVQG
ncbi:MAG: VanZ family protein [Desulfobulbaceae bacterium]|nr:VanZ family protein [Desulfobulbaceae bacterium]